MNAPKVTRATLRGAAVLTVEEHSLPVVRFVIALRRGSAVDPDNQSGALRAMMELMLRGTATKDREQFNAELEELGSSFNSVPGSEAAYFRGVTLKKNLQSTVALIAEALGSPAFDADEHAALIDEMVQALASDRDDDDTVAELFLRRLFYTGHPLQRSPLGEAPQVAKLDVESLRALHQDRLVTSDMIIAFAGDITPEESMQAATVIAERLPGGTQPPPLAKALPPLPQPNGLRIVLADKPDRAQVQLRVAHPGLSGTHPDTLALWLGIVAFGGTFTSPLTQEVRDVRGWSYVAHADFSRRQVLPSPIVLRTVPPKDDAVACLALELELMEKLAQGQLPQAALDRARSYMLGRYPFEVATAADMLNPVIRCELLGEPATEIFTTPQKIEALTDAEVRAALIKHLQPGNLTVSMVSTAKDIEDTLATKLPNATISVVDFRTELGG